MARLSSSLDPQPSGSSPGPGLIERAVSGCSWDGDARVCPGGSGKTVLVRLWAAERDAATAWVTVDRGERDAQRFWIQRIDALADAAGDEVVERVSAAPRFAGAGWSSDS